MIATIKIDDAEIGPRRTGLLKSWAENAYSTTTGPYHDFGSKNRHERVQAALQQFVDSPSESSFSDLWNKEVLRDAVMGSPDLVLNKWPASIEDLAMLFEEMREADEYDEFWSKSLWSRQRQCSDKRCQSD